MEITLRPWHIDDADELATLANNSNIAKFMANVFPYPYTIENAKTFIALANNSSNPSLPLSIRFAIIMDDQLVGGIGLHLQSDILRKNAEIGYWIGEPYWGKGIAGKAIPQIIEYGFQNMDIVRIFARIFGTNIASQKVVEKCGFILEGKYEKTLYKNDEFLDELIYAVRKKSN